MEKLSKEKFLNILSRLDFLTKIDCILVCKQWEQWIQINRVLFDSER